MSSNMKELEVSSCGTWFRPFKPTTYLLVQWDLSAHCQPRQPTTPNPNDALSTFPPSLLQLLLSACASEPVPRASRSPGLQLCNKQTTQ